MKRITLLSSTLLLLGACATSPSIETVKTDITATMDSLNARYAVAFRNVQTGEELLINEHEMFHAASTMKTPVMVELFKQSRQGKFSFSDSVKVHTVFNSIVDSTFSLSPGDDSDSALYQFDGQMHPVSDLLNRMITRSSNLATNLLIEMVDARNVTATMRELGANDILVLRGVEDGKAFRAGLNNQTSAYDLMLVFDAMARRSLVDQQASDEMVSILLQQEFNEMIPALLPADVKVAHKTGWITGVHHDSGIVILPDGRRYVLVLLTADLKNEEAGVKALARASKMIYDYVTAGD